MKQTVNFYDFERAFADHGRSEQFTYEGLRVLFDFLEEMESDAGEEIELDVIGLCCDFCEMDQEELINNYSPDDLDVDSTQNEIIEYLCDNTMYCGITDSGNYVFTAF